MSEWAETMEAQEYRRLAAVMRARQSGVPAYLELPAPGNERR
ncbi:hypothetical protein AB0K09_26185 [Streptomyces sp. NPDC049577]